MCVLMVIDEIITAFLNFYYYLLLIVHFPVPIVHGCDWFEVGVLKLSCEGPPPTTVFGLLPPFFSVASSNMFTRDLTITFLV